MFDVSDHVQMGHIYQLLGKWVTYISYWENLVLIPASLSKSMGEKRMRQIIDNFDIKIISKILKMFRSYVWPEFHNFKGMERVIMNSKEFSYAWKPSFRTTLSGLRLMIICTSNSQKINILYNNRDAIVCFHNSEIQHVLKILYLTGYGKLEVKANKFKFSVT